MENLEADYLTLSSDDARTYRLLKKKKEEFNKNKKIEDEEYYNMILEGE